MLFCGHMLLVLLTVKKSLEYFMWKNCKKGNQAGVWKVIQRKGDKLYVKWKGYNNLIDIWINKKDIV